MGSYHRTSFKRPIFSPRASGSLATNNPLEGEVSSLPDLIRFNARENPHHLFALQSELSENTPERGGQDVYEASQITFEELNYMVNSCASWISSTATFDSRNEQHDEHEPIAIYVESGIGLFVHLAALLSMDIPALLISARLSSSSVEHLLRKTGAKTVLVSRRTKLSLSHEIHDIAQVIEVKPYSTHMGHGASSSNDKTREAPRNGHQFRDNDRRSALILHSSGTTGLPKPIFLTHRYILGYAACHEFPPNEDIYWTNLSTLPLYHGFGLLAPCLSLSIGMTACFPPPSIIPATKSTLDLIRTFNCQSLMTVPSIVDDILCLPNESERGGALELLAKLEFLAVGGGALKTDQGIILVEHGVKLLNHYGVTEIGAIAPIFRPGSDYDWRFLRLRTDLGLELRPIPDSAFFRLVGYPIGWEGPFEVQDQLERNEASSRMEVRILGRTDDVIVLKTGEKVHPRQLEDALNADPTIRTAVCVGNGFFELLVIIDPINQEADAEIIKDHVWKLLSVINPSVDHHARIMSRKAIIVKSSEKTIPRSDKGSVMRQSTHEIFKQEISDAYIAMELDSLGEDFILDPTNLETGIRRLIAAVASNRLSSEGMGADDDFFESGMDSLQTVLFARLLGSGLRGLRKEDQGGGIQISADFIYRNPSINRLAAASARLISLGGESAADIREDRATRMRDLVNESITEAFRQTVPTQTKHTILMTGSTGNLGAHTLGRLTRIGSVDKIICLVRGQDQISNGDSSALNNEKAEPILPYRQRRALEDAGVHIEPEEWKKLEFLDLASVIGDETTEAQVSNFANRITHILHLAWPMDFQRELESFKSHIKLLQTLVKLAQQAYVARGAREPIRLLFSSSIAVVRYHAEQNGKGNDGSFRSVVPELAVQNPLVPVPMGYAEAKWVCEAYLDHIAKHLSGVEPVVVRVGQLSGPERTSGIWKTDEHIPMMIRASQELGAFPELEGTASWMPVDRAAHSLGEMLLREGEIDTFLHLENPVRQPLKDIFTIMAREMQLPRPFMIPFEQWLRRATATGEVRSLDSFYRDHFRELAGGRVTLDTAKARALSSCLRGSGALDKALITEYLHRWQRDGFLK